MHVIAYRGCMNVLRESALKADREKNLLSHHRVKPESVLHLAFQSSAVPTN